MVRFSFRIMHSFCSYHFSMVINARLWIDGLFIFQCLSQLVDRRKRQHEVHQGRLCRA